MERRESLYYGAGTIEGGMLYRHVEVATKIVSDQPDPFVDLSKDINLKDMIVVIGSSAVSGSDRHATPLGQMTGAEVIINTARSFADFEPATADATLLSAILSDLPASFTSSLIVLGLVWLSGYVRSIARTSAQRILAIAVCELITIVGIWLAIVIAVVFAYWQLAFTNGANSTDFLLPVIAVLFQSILEFFSRLLNMCEKVSDKILNYSSSLIRHLI
jgi:hypothetical protein